MIIFIADVDLYLIQLGGPASDRDLRAFFNLLFVKNVAEFVPGLQGLAPFVFVKLILLLPLNLTLSNL